MEDSTVRYCTVCGKPIIQRPGEDNHHFGKRISCGWGTPCHQSLCGKRLKLNRLAGKVPEVVFHGQIYDSPADAAQAAVNIHLAKLDAERRGLIVGPVKVYRGAELQQILAEITPIERIVKRG